MNNKFNNVEADELYAIEIMCKAIEDKRVILVCTDKHWKMIVPSEMNGYPYDYTRFLYEWGFAEKARNKHFLARLNPYTPNLYMSKTLANFLNKSVENGYYKRTNEVIFNGGQDFTTIWM